MVSRLHKQGCAEITPSCLNWGFSEILSSADLDLKTAENDLISVTLVLNVAITSTLFHSWVDLLKGQKLEYKVKLRISG